MLCKISDDHAKSFIYWEKNPPVTTARYKKCSRSDRKAHYSFIHLLYKCISQLFKQHGCHGEIPQLIRDGANLPGGSHPQKMNRALEPSSMIQSKRKIIFPLIFQSIFFY